MYFRDLAEQYFQYKSIYNKSIKNDISRYNNHIADHLDNIKIDFIKRADIEEIQIKLINKNLSNKTVNHITTLISTMLEYAVDRELLTHNPAKLIRKLRVNNDRERFLTVAEIRTLIDHFKDEYEPNLFIKLSLSTGARLNSVVELKRKHINYDNKTVLLHDYKSESTYTAFLNAMALESLNELRDLRPEQNIFSLKYDYLQKRVQKAMNELFNQGLDKNDRINRVVVHTLRHTFASHLAINGTPIAILQRLMNHKTIAMTMRYAKLLPDTGRDYVEKLYK